jgi:hypothetical protein
MKASLSMYPFSAKKIKICKRSNIIIQCGRNWRYMAAMFCKGIVRRSKRELDQTSNRLHPRSQQNPNSED